LQNHNFTIPNRNTRCYYHLKEECLHFRSDLKCAPRATRQMSRRYSHSRQTVSSVSCVTFPIAVATIRPFQMLGSLCVIDASVTILQHFLLKLRRNEILLQFIRTLYYKLRNKKNLQEYIMSSFKTIFHNLTGGNKKIIKKMSLR
jgi:hypothetical protein